MLLRTSQSELSSEGILFWVRSARIDLKQVALLGTILQPVTHQVI